MPKNWHICIASAVLTISGCATVVTKEPMYLECESEEDCKGQANNFCGKEGYREIHRKELPRPPAEDVGNEWHVARESGTHKDKPYLFLLIKCGTAEQPSLAEEQPHEPRNTCPVVEARAREWIMPDGSIGYEMPDCGNDFECSELARQKCRSKNIAFFPASGTSIGKAVYQCLKISDNCEGRNHD
jgi:hypothetical protein